MYCVLLKLTHVGPESQSTNFLGGHYSLFQRNVRLGNFLLIHLGLWIMLDKIEAKAKKPYRIFLNLSYCLYF